MHTLIEKGLFFCHTRYIHVTVITTWHMWSKYTVAILHVIWHVAKVLPVIITVIVVYTTNTEGKVNLQKWLIKAYPCWKCGVMHDKFYHTNWVIHATTLVNQHTCVPIVCMKWRELLWRKEHQWLQKWWQLHQWPPQCHEGTVPSVHTQGGRVKCFPQHCRRSPPGTGVCCSCFLSKRRKYISESDSIYSS